MDVNAKCSYTRTQSVHPEGGEYFFFPQGAGAMAHVAMAANCPGFKHALEHDLDPQFRKVLIDAAFDNALQWALTLESVANSASASRELHEMLRALGATAEEADERLPQAKALYTLACDLAPSAHRRVGSLHGLALSADLETHRRAGLLRKENLRN